MENSKENMDFYIRVLRVKVQLRDSQTRRGPEVAKASSSMTEIMKAVHGCSAVGIYPSFAESVSKNGAF